jgi:UDP-N-acetylglucosamine 1-carboxyvinyltransferase
VQGTNTIHDSVYEGRFGHIPYLTKMGANIKVEGSVTIVSGVSALSGADVKATDLRAGAALVVAGLAATGQTRIFDIHHIERGYQDLCLRLRQLGARCWRVNIGNADSVVME